MQIRQRRDADLEQLEIVARRVQAADQYPIYLPDGDFHRFLTQPASITAWVMADEDRVVGHVALNDATSAPVMRAVADHGHDSPARYLARLLVDPGARRTGAGRTLLEHARREAVATGCLPVLDPNRSTGNRALPTIRLARDRTRQLRPGQPANRRDRLCRTNSLSAHINAAAVVISPSENGTSTTARERHVRSVDPDQIARLGSTPANHSPLPSIGRGPNVAVLHVLDWVRP